ncbi:unnamed protein product [Discula destructiva]
MSINWADEVEESLAERASQAQQQFPPANAQAEAEPEKTRTPHNGTTSSVLEPKSNGHEVEREHVSSPVQPHQRTPSPVAKGGMSQSRWANAPAEPVVHQSPARPSTDLDSTTSPDQDGNPEVEKSRKSRNKKARGKKGAGKPKNVNSTRSRGDSGASSSSHVIRSEDSTQTAGAVSGSNAQKTDEQPAIIQSVDHTKAEPASKPRASCSAKNEIYLSRWASEPAA